jgi:hypothetical protein
VLDEMDKYDVPQATAEARKEQDAILLFPGIRASQRGVFNNRLMKLCARASFDFEVFPTIIPASNAMPRD